MSEQCMNCRFFHFEMLDPPPHKFESAIMQCHRFPKWEDVTHDHYCGEFRFADWFPPAPPAPAEGAAA